jgi:hypothetical protein
MPATRRSDVAVTFQLAIQPLAIPRSFMRFHTRASIQNCRLQIAAEVRKFDASFLQFYSCTLKSHWLCYQTTG